MENTGRSSIVLRAWERPADAKRIEDSTCCGCETGCNCEELPTDCFRASRRCCDRVRPDAIIRNMNGEVDALIYSWLHDIHRWLMNSLDNLKDDLGSDDAAINARATKEAQQIMDWLFPPPPPLSAQERARHQPQPPMTQH